jgi:hypothetical protein
MLSLSIFLQPMTQAMGWSRPGISTAALVNWLAMGVGAFLWGALPDGSAPAPSCSWVAAPRARLSARAGPRRSSSSSSCSGCWWGSPRAASTRP